MRCCIGETVINYDVKGTGMPILFFSGFINDMTTMINCMEPIFKKSNDWKRIYIDHPGVGETSIGKNITCLEDFLKVLIQFVEKIVKDEKFILAGYSFGGYLSRYILNKKYETVEGLLLISPLVSKDIENCDVDREVEKIKHKDKEIQQKIDDRILKDTKESTVKTNHHFLQILQKNATDVVITLDEFVFEKPTLIITGRQDNVVGYKDAYNILEHFPRATYCVLDKGGHSIQFEQEKLFNVLVKEWLYRLKENIN